MTQSRVCPLCDANDWLPFLTTHNGRIMTGDQRIVSGDLQKVSCSQCGCVANAYEHTDAQLDSLYGEEYTLNTMGGEEHQFFLSDGPVPRSKIFFDWILPYVPNRFTSLLEIGCGSGNVLQRFCQHFPDRNIRGLDGSYRACEIAREKGLVVDRLLINDATTEIPPAEVILSIAVLEHVEDILWFLATLMRGLNRGGRMIFCVPVQDELGYDIFFAEHVWHFTFRQWIALFERCGLTVAHAEHRHPVNSGFGLFVCEKGSQKKTVKIGNEPSTVIRNRDHWQTHLNRIDRWLGRHPNDRLALFGSGEVATLFLTFTSLGERNVVACIDEDPEKIGTEKHGIPVYGVDWLAEGAVDAVLLTINPRYHGQVVEKLKPFDLNIFSYSKDN